MKHKSLLIVLTVLFTVVVAFSVFFLIWFWGDTYPDMDEFSVGVQIPGLDEGAVPQGLASYNTSYTLENEDGTTQTGKQDYYFISAYMKNGPSRIYVTGAKTGPVGYVTMVNDGEDFYGHCGGIATSGTTLWVASDGYVYVAKRSGTTYSNIAEEIIAKAKANGRLLSDAEENAQDGEDGEGAALQTIEFTAKFNANCNASFCYYYASGSKLYVGEFYRKGNYETDLKHRMTTPAGDENTAVVYEYTVSTSTSYQYGLTPLTSTNLSEENKVPKIQRIYSITGLIQGFARTSDGSIVLSQSYGLAPSHLLVYDYNTVNASLKKYNSIDGMKNFAYDGITTIYGNAYTDSSLYVYFIDSAALVGDYTLPSMSEGLCVTSDGKVNVLFESGSYKYKRFVRQIETNIYSFVPKKKD